MCFDYCLLFFIFALDFQLSFHQKIRFSHSFKIEQKLLQLQLFFISFAQKQIWKIVFEEFSLKQS